MLLLNVLLVCSALSYGADVAWSVTVGFASLSIWHNDTITI